MNWPVGSVAVQTEYALTPDRMPNKKAEPTKGIILRQLGRLGLLRPVAFRPLLTKGLALS